EVFENVILIVTIQIEKLFIMFLLTNFLHTMDAIQKHLSTIQFGLWAMCIRFLWPIWAFHIIFVVGSPKSRQLFVDKVRNPKRNSTWSCIIFRETTLCCRSYRFEIITPVEKGSSILQ